MAPSVIEQFQKSCLAGERFEALASDGTSTGGRGRANADPKSPATINHRVAVLRQAFRLAHKQGRLSRIPYFPMIEADNARQGFLDPADVANLLSVLPIDIADATEFAYVAGWRKGQIEKLEWEHVDRTNRLLAVPGRIVKNRKPANGVDRAVAKKITGDKTDSMLDRYNIVDTRDQEIALGRLEAFLDHARSAASSRQ